MNMHLLEVKMWFQLWISKQEQVNYVQNCYVYKYYNYNNEQVYHCRYEKVKLHGIV